MQTDVKIANNGMALARLADFRVALLLALFKVRTHANFTLIAVLAKLR